MRNWQKYILTGTITLASSLSITSLVTSQALSTNADQQATDIVAFNADLEQLTTVAGRSESESKSIPPIGSSSRRGC